jgi:cyclopropane fatty-acyl-phospholipid synthase-like methyltransferase
VTRAPELTISAWLRFDAIRRSLEITAARRVLEIGSGEGALGAWLARRYEYLGVEPDERSRHVAQARLRAVGRGEVVDRLAQGAHLSYDAVCAFEVLEHIEDDRQALAAWREHLVPRGFLLLSVPAHAERFGPSDRYVGHFRRYDRAHLRERLEGAGFEIVRCQSYGAGLGQLLDAVRNAMLRRRPAMSRVEERTAGSGRLFQPRGAAHVVFNHMVALPFRLLQTPLAGTDIGIGYVVLARLR